MATASRVNVNLAFTANTTQAKQQLQELQTTLNNLSSGSNVANLGQNISNSLNRSIATANSLKAAIMGATNADTGKLDLSRFNQSLQASGRTLKSVFDDLVRLGPEGQTAFKQLATSIQQAEIPMRTANTALDKMWVTMKNTMKWQISAAALRSFTSAISGAFDYAKDLNESLNNIRIVTGYSSDEMAKFAQQANKAAKALSTNTIAYTDAALIYYQQGLKGKDVSNRTDTTVKLANVTGESAETVSQWMTAIWNNFDDGSKSLEYYADVVSKLGAETASSADEIATGLEKFSAVADTVGLSYEYATAALATVTSQTRQSADVVGTAFKTLFARMQDLKLGETLEDGTTLGQYSAAMAKVGVDIKSASGELKDMNTIIDELGGTWNTLNKDQQVALAKSVAGLRQYNQFIALMDNYDMFKGLVGSAESASGTLQNQADTYAESWAAANQRVKASAESLYSALIDDDFFIDLTDGAAKFIDIIKKVIDAMGGVKGLLPLLFVGFTKLFGDQMIAGIRNFTQNLQASGRAAQQQGLELKRQATILDATADGGDLGSGAGQTSMKIADLKEKAYGIQHRLTEQESNYINIIFTELEGVKEIVAEMEKRKQLAEETANIAAKSSADFISKKNRNKDDGSGERWGNQEEYKKDFDAESKKIEEATRLEDTMLTGATDEDRSKAFKDLQDKGFFKDKKSYDEVINVDDKGQRSMKEGMSAVDKQIKTSSETLKNKYQGAVKKTAGTVEDFVEAQEDALKATKKKTQAAINEEKITSKSGKTLEEYGKQIDVISKKPLSATIMQSAQSISQLAMGVSSMTAAWKTITDMWEEGEVSFSGLLSIMTSAGMAIPMIINGLNGLTSAMGLTNVTSALTYKLSNLNTKQKVQEALANEGLSLSEKAEWLAKTLNISTDKAAILLSGAKIAGKTGEKVATDSNTVSIWSEVGAKIASLFFDWQKLIVTALIIAAFIVLIATIAAVIAIFKGLADAYNADSIAAKQAAEEAQGLAESLEKAKEALNDMKDSFKAYEEAQEAIEKLTVGTEEWTEAVEKSNEQVLSLLEKYPELAKYVSTDGGILKISQEGMDRMLQETKDSVAALQKLSGAANIRAKETRLKADYTDLVRDGKSMASLFFSPMAKTIDNSIRKGVIDEALKMYQQEGNAGFASTSNQKSIFERLGLDSEKDKELIDGIKELTDSMNELNAQIKAQNEIDTLTTLQSYGGFNEKEYTGIHKQVATDAYDAALKQKQAELEGTTELSKKWIDTGWGEAVSVAMAAGTAGIGTLSGPVGTLGSAAAGYELARGIFGAIDVEGADLNDTLQEYLKTRYPGMDVNDDTISYNAGDDHVKVTYSGEGDYDVEDTIITYDNLMKFKAEQELDKDAIYDIYSKSVNYGNDLSQKVGRADAGTGPEVSAEERAFAAYLETGSFDSIGDVVIDETKLQELSKEYAGIIGQSADIIWQAAQDKLQEWNSLTIDQKNQKQHEAEQAQYDATIQEGAQAAGVSTAAMEAYTKSLMRNSKSTDMNRTAAAKLAASHFKMATGIKSVNEITKKWQKTLQAGESDIFDYSVAVGELSEALSSAFGFEISTDFVKEHRGDLLKMLEGDIEALKRVKNDAAKEFIVTLDLDTDTTSRLQKELEDFQNGIDFSVEGHVELNTAGFLNSLNELSMQGKITSDQIQGVFASMDLSFPDTEIRSIPWKTVTKSESTNIIATTDLETNTTKNNKVTTTTYTTNESSIPWIGDNPPVQVEQKDASTGVVTGYTVKEGTGTNKTPNNTAMAYNKGASDSTLSSMLKYTNSDDQQEKEARKLEDEIERYKEIEDLLSSLEKRYDAIEQAKDRAFGDAKVKYFEQGIQNLNTQLEKMTSVYLPEIKKNFMSDAGIMKGYGATFDEFGNITNYDELMAKYIGSDDNTWNAFTSAMDRYDQTKNKLVDMESQIAEMEAEIEDQTLEKIQYKVEYEIELNELDTEHLEWQLEHIEDKAYETAAAIANMFEQMNEASDSFDVNLQGFKETLQDAGVNQEDIDSYLSGNYNAIDFTSLNISDQRREQLLEYLSAMRDSESNIREMQDQIFESLGEAMDNMVEDFDIGIEKMDSISSTLGSLIDLVDLVGQEKLGISDENIAAIQQTQINALKASTNLAKAARDTRKAAMEELQKAYNEATTEVEKEKLKQLLQEAEIAYQESETSLIESFTAQMEQFDTIWERSMENMQKAFEKSMSGIHGSLDNLMKSFERMTNLNELYLQDYQKTYETTKLMRNIQKDIDKSDNIKAQQELSKLSEEIAQYQTAGAKMSKYDLEYLQKKYDLKLAEIALEEAQNAKSQVSLRRDASGSYGYVYTADENSVNEAQQNFDDAQYGYQDWSYNAEKELTNLQLSLKQEFLADLYELEEQYKNDEVALYDARVELINYYKEQFGFTLGELQGLMENNAVINRHYTTSMADSWSDSLLGQMYPDLRSFDEYNNLLQTNIQTAVKTSSQVFTEWSKNTAAVTKEMSTSVEGLQEQLTNGEDGYLDKIDQKIEETSQSADDMKDAIINSFIEAVNSATEQYSSFATKMGNYQAIINNVKSLVDGLAGSYQNMASQANAAADAAARANSAGGSGGTGGTNDYIPEDPPDPKKTYHVVGSTNSIEQQNDNIIGVTDSAGKTTYFKASDLSIVSGTKKEVAGKKNTYEADVTASGSAYTYKYVAAANADTFDFGSSIGTYVRGTDGLYYKTTDLVRNKSNGTLTTYFRKSSVSGVKGSTLPVFTMNQDTLKFDNNKHAKGQGSDGEYYTNTSTIKNTWPLKITGIIRCNNVNTPDKYLYKVDVTDNSGNASDIERKYWNSAYFSAGKQQFDTGGYTGEWGPEGRWAMLHQKEIVLNKHDTENFLTAIDILRGMQDNLLSTQMQQALQKFSSNITPLLNNTSNNNAIQNIYVTAEFPNATDRYEIEQAFNSLANDFSQKINKV